MFQSFAVGTPVRIYLPFLVSAGEPDCQWATSTTTMDTNTTLDVSLNPSGQTVTLNATVSPSTASGTVSFFYGVTPMGSSALSNGMATFVPPFGLGEGLWNFVAKYNGDGNYGRSSGTKTQLVKLTTSTSVTSAISGQFVIFTASVNAPNATGTVTFSDGGRLLGVKTLNSGKAICGSDSSCSTSGLAAGSHSITVT